MSQLYDADSDYEGDYFERNPDDLVANGLRPVWTSWARYPGEIPADIAEEIGPNTHRACRLIGPLSSLFWLGKFDDLVDAIESDDFTAKDSIASVPINWTIRGCMDNFYHERRVPGYVLRQYLDPKPPSSVMAFPVQQTSIPTCVTGSLTSQSLHDLFPFCQPQDFANQVLTIKIKREKAPWLEDVVRDYALRNINGNLLFRGLGTWALASSMAFFAPVISASSIENEFGPGIYTTPALHIALQHAGTNGAIMVFQNTDMRNVSVWEPSVEDWETIVRYWTGRVITDVQNRIPQEWNCDFIKGPVSVQGRRHERVRGPDQQVVAVSHSAALALARSLKMIIWIYRA